MAQLQEQRSGDAATPWAAVRSQQQLQELVSSGVQPEYLLFWVHQPPKGGGVRAGCLS